MKRKIIGATVGSPLPKPNLMQTDPTKGDYVKGKEEFLDGNTGTLYVHATTDDYGLYSADKNSSEIIEAAGNGKTVILMYEDGDEVRLFPLHRIADDIVYFNGILEISEGERFTVDITVEGNDVDVVAIPLVDDSSVCNVTFSQNADGSYYADKTRMEVFGAYAAGKIVYCTIQVGWIPGAHIYLVATPAMTLRFEGIVVGKHVAVEYTYNDTANPPVDNIINVTITELSTGGSGYATQEWVRLGYQPKGNYAQSDDIPTDQHINELIDTKLKDLPDSGGNIDLTGVVKSVNGQTPDENGNVEIMVSGATVATVEPAEDDMPKVFFEGDITGMSKDVSKDLSISYRSKSLSFEGTVEMKWQGSSSVRWPKKNFTIKMFTDSTKGEKLKKDFRGWGAQNKFCLKANYVDHSHARNVVSAKLWDEVVKSRSDYDSLPEEMRNSPRNGAVDGFPIKVYINGTYEGVYTWNIPKDGWMFNMTEDNPNHCVLCGANNSAGGGRPTPTSCQFRIPYNSADWKTEFPDVLSQDMINKFNRVVTFMTTSTDDDFKAHLGDYVNVQSAIDYRIFADVIAHHDGLGNNMIFLTYDGVVWFFSMYDMDSTHGLWWDGTKFVATDLAFPSGFQEPENLMWERLDECFANEIKERYSELRKSVLSVANMDTHFERFMDVIGSDLYAEDLTIYTGIPSGSTNNIKQIRNYIRDRLTYVDGEIAALGEIPEQVPCTGIALSVSELTFTAEGSQTLTATVTPDGCTDVVTWESNNTSVATVNGGVVTAIANGSATITAKCGEYSASCSVSVSLAEEPDEPDEPVLSSELIHSFEGVNATSTAWVDSVDPSYQFNFTGSPTVENGAVKFTTSSYGVLNKELGISGQDYVLKTRCAIDAAKNETWAVGTPNWKNGFIIGRKTDGCYVESGNASGASLKVSSNNDGLMHDFVICYSHAASGVYVVFDGQYCGRFSGGFSNSISGIVNLNNEGTNYRGANSVEYLRIYSPSTNAYKLVETVDVKRGHVIGTTGVFGDGETHNYAGEDYIPVNRGFYKVLIPSELTQSYVFCYDESYEYLDTLRTNATESEVLFFVPESGYIRIAANGGAGLEQFSIEVYEGTLID